MQMEAKCCILQSCLPYKGSLALLTVRLPVGLVELQLCHSRACLWPLCPCHAPQAAASYCQKSGGKSFIQGPGSSTLNLAGVSNGSHHQPWTADFQVCVSFITTSPVVLAT